MLTITRGSSVCEGSFASARAPLRAFTSLRIGFYHQKRPCLQLCQVKTGSQGELHLVGTRDERDGSTTFTFGTEAEAAQAKKSKTKKKPADAPSKSAKEKSASAGTSASSASSSPPAGSNQSSKPDPSTPSTYSQPAPPAQNSNSSSSPNSSPYSQEEAAASNGSDYASLKVTELKELCKERNVPGYSKMLKRDLIDALSGHTSS